jgi:hypothetical protein
MTEERKPLEEDDPDKEWILATVERFKEWKKEPAHLREDWDTVCKRFWEENGW